jgi:hypothetical protein
MMRMKAHGKLRKDADPAALATATMASDQRESVHSRHPEVRHQDVGSFDIQHADGTRRRNVRPAT